MRNLTQNVLKALYNDLIAFRGNLMVSPLSVYDFYEKNKIKYDSIK